MRMTVNEYQIEALRTLPGRSERDAIDILEEGLMGLNGESGECVDLLKKHKFQGHDLDNEHLVKELGDVSWYLAISAYAIGCDLETVFRKNIEKLRERYPDGFDVELSKNRKVGDI